eukprot:3821950-Pyramimonas_sp.AAC.1
MDKVSRVVIIPHRIFRAGECIQGRHRREASSCRTPFTLALASVPENTTSNLQLQPTISDVDIDAHRMHYKSILVDSSC